LQRKTCSVALSDDEHCPGPLGEQLLTISLPQRLSMPCPPRSSGTKPLPAQLSPS